MATDSTATESQEKPKPKTRAKTTAKTRAKAKTKSKATSKKREPRRPNNDQPQRDERGRLLPGSSIAAKWTEPKALKLAKELIDWMQESTQNFWMKDFLLEHELYDDVINYLSNKFQRFSDYITRAKAIQASRIQKFAMMNQLNSGMAQWVLSVHHKMRVKSEVEVNNSQPIVIHMDPRIAEEEGLEEDLAGDSASSAADSQSQSADSSGNR